MDKYELLKKTIYEALETLKQIEKDCPDAYTVSSLRVLRTAIKMRMETIEKIGE